MSSRTRIIGSIAGGAAALTLLAACGTDGDDAGSAESSGARPDAAKAQSLVLTADDFPQGFELLDVPKDQMVDLAKVADAASGGSVTPAECGATGVFPDDPKPDSFGIAAAAKGGEGTIIQAITTVDRSIADFRESVTGKCATVKAKISSGPTAGLEATIKTTVLDAPDTAAGSDVLVYQQDSTSKASGQTARTRSLTGVAKVGGYVVRVQYSPTLTGLEVNRKAFDDTFVKAVAKVAEQAGR